MYSLYLSRGVEWKPLPIDKMLKEANTRFSLAASGCFESPASVFCLKNSLKIIQWTELCCSLSNHYQFFTESWIIEMLVNKEWSTSGLPLAKLRICLMVILESISNLSNTWKLLLKKLFLSVRKVRNALIIVKHDRPMMFDKIENLEPSYRRCRNGELFPFPSGLWSYNFHFAK